MDLSMGGFRQHSKLPRLSKSNYLGFATIHWIMTIEGRKTGWLNSQFHSQFREILLHALVRYNLAAPCYCLMPDHVHLLLKGLGSNANQRNALSFLRRYLNGNLAPFRRFQRQAYDHVLREEEQHHDAFQSLVFYILANPVRAGLVTQRSNQDYPFCGCMVVGYPVIDVFHEGFQPLFWKLIHKAMNNPWPTV